MEQHQYAGSHACSNDSSPQSHLWCQALGCSIGEFQQLEVLPPCLQKRTLRQGRVERTAGSLRGDLRNEANHCLMWGEISPQILQSVCSLGLFLGTVFWAVRVPKRSQKKVKKHKDFGGSFHSRSHARLQGGDISNCGSEQTHPSRPRNSPCSQLSTSNANDL